MISLYSGTPGSGKSLHVAKNIYQGLKRGRTILCNFDIDKSRIRPKDPESLKFYYVENSDLNYDYLLEFARNYWSDKKRVKEDEILLVIDECQLVFNSRDWSREGRKEWLTFFSQHRKLGFEVILVAQFDEMIDKQIRSLIEYEYKHRKALNFGTAGIIFSLIAMGNLFCSIQYWYPMKERLGSSFFKAKKKYYSIYDTFGLFEDPDKVLGKRG